MNLRQSTSIIKSRTKEEIKFFFITLEFLVLTDILAILSQGCVILELPRLFRRPISAETHDLVMVQPKKFRLANYAPNDLKFFLRHFRPIKNFSQLVLII